MWYNTFDQGGEAIIWFEMSYNNYWAYRDLSLSQRCENEPDDFDIDNDQEQEEDNWALIGNVFCIRFVLMLFMSQKNKRYISGC